MMLVTTKPFNTSMKIPSHFYVVNKTSLKDVKLHVGDKCQQR